MRLTFPYQQLRILLANAETRWPLGLRPRYGLNEPAGFWLVGDQGVYLMHNGKAVEGKQPIVYALECNPDTMPFDQWWAAKQASFGADDGTEFIEAKVIRDAVTNGGSLFVDFTDTTISVFTQVVAANEDRTPSGGDL